MNRKLHVIGLLTFCLAFLIIPITQSGSGYWDVSTHWNFYSTPTGGPISFTNDFTTTQMQFTNNLIIFNDFNMGTLWSSLGFHSPTGTTLQVDSVTTNQVSLTTTIPGGFSTFKVYTGSKGVPTSVSGASFWSYGSQTVTLEMTSGGAIVLSWTTVAPTSATNLLNQYLTLGDLSGYIIAQYTSIMGLAFFALILMVPVLGTYIKSGAGPAILVTLAGWGIFSAVIPGVGLNLVFILLVIGIGLYFAWLFLSRRTGF